MPLLTNDLWRTWFCEAVDRAVSRHGYRQFAFVVMPEHVHLLVHPRQGASRVATLLTAIKRPFSGRIKQELGQRSSQLVARLTVRQRPGVKTFRFWQEDPGYDRNLFDPRSIILAIDYLHANPVRRRLCERPIDWKWSSARYHMLPDEPPDPVLPRLTPLPPELLE
jgi:putative transposase